MPPPKKPATVSPLVQIKEIENDPVVKQLISEKLPPNYDFEIGKTIWRIRKNPDCKTVALQFPEGLLIFSTRIGSILTQLTGVDIILLGDITYGACCIDDYTASMLGADLLVHYGHSCLVPTVVANKLDTIYVFVTIRFNLDIAVASIAKLIQEWIAEKKRGRGKIEYEDGGGTTNVSLVSTIQFALSLGTLKSELEKNLEGVSVTIPRSKPLSNGEILGCTAPTVKGTDMIVYVGDGRFHLEAMMMANPGVVAYRYDPYNTTTTLEEFDHSALAKSRSSVISRILSDPKSDQRIGIILGTLGRQGNPKPMEHVYDKLSEGGFRPFITLMSEVMPAKLELFKDVDGWVQFACPRLSIDWGESFTVPVLTSYEGMMVAGRKKCCAGSSCHGNSNNECGYQHPMDFYAFDSCGEHTPNYKPSVAKK